MSRSVRDEVCWYCQRPDSHPCKNRYESFNCGHAPEEQVKPEPQEKLEWPVYEEAKGG